MSRSELPAPEMIEIETNCSMSKSELPPTVLIDQEANSSMDIICNILDQKSSTVFCKICHSGGSNEQLIQPCLCKGNRIKISPMSQM